MRLIFALWPILLVLALPTLACGPAAFRVTPTPTKTPKIIELPDQEPTPTALAVPVLPTDTPAPPEPPTSTPTPPPPDTPTPEPPPTEPPPTDTPPPPPPPTNTPIPPPPPTEPPPPPPTEPPPPPSSAPTIVIELPNGDTFTTGDEVVVKITVSDPDGVGNFKWGVFTENRTPVTGGDRDCGNAAQCQVEEEFDAQLPGTFQIGVEAKDAAGNGAINTRQIYVG